VSLKTFCHFQNMLEMSPSTFWLLQNMLKYKKYTLVINHK
jgi:hypothetical protein